MKHLNRVCTWIVLCAAVLACEQVEEQVAQFKTTVILDLDVSTSVLFDSTTMLSFVSGIVEKHLLQDGDELVVIYAGNTGYNLEQLRTFKISVPAVEHEMSELKSIEETKRREEALVKEQERILREVVEAVSVRRTDNETHLLASLATVRDVQRNAGENQCHLYILSDFIEDSPIRSLEGLQFESKSEAVQLAKQDLSFITEKYGFEKHVTKMKSVHLVTPSCLGGTTAKRNDQGFVMAYWKEVLSLWSQSVAIDMTCP